MIVSRGIASTAIAGSAIVDMWAASQDGHEPCLIALVAAVNLLAFAMIRYAWRRAARKSAKTYFTAGQTIDVILREYAARRAAPPDKR